MAKYYYFDRILEDTDIRDICGYFTPVVKGDKVHCPEPGHTDKRPSCRLFPKENKYYCQSCGGHGSGIDIVMKNLNLSTTEACEWLIAQYGLNEDNYIDYSRSGDKKHSKGLKIKKKHYIDVKKYEVFGIISNNVDIPVNCHEYRDEVSEQDLRKLSPFQLKELKEKVISVLPEQLKERAVVTNKVKKSSHDLSGYNACIVFKGNPHTINWEDIWKKLKLIGAGKIEQFGNMLCIYINPGKQLINMGIYNPEYIMYQRACKNPLQSLYNEDKEAFEFLIKSKAMNRLSEISVLRNKISLSEKETDTLMSNIISELDVMGIDREHIISCLDEAAHNVKESYFELTGKKL